MLDCFDHGLQGNNALIERRNSRKSKDKDKESAVSSNPRKRKSISQVLLICIFVSSI